MEWLGSPIVYRENYSVATQMRDLASRHYSPVACFHHYLHMAQGNYREYLKGPVVWIKKYFYVLRPLLAIRWIEQDLGVVPTEFQKLVDGMVDSPELRSEIEKLIASKRVGEELARGPRMPAISNFISGEMIRLGSKQFELEPGKPVVPVHEFDRLFRSALDEGWLQRKSGK